MILKNQKTTKDKMWSVLKKYFYVIVAAVLLITLSIILAVSVNNTQVIDKNLNNNINSEPVNSSAVTFYSPVLNCSAIKDFSDTNLMFNETLNQWEAHMALDLSANAGDNVYAALDGKVVAVYDNYLDGKVVELEHKNNMKTIYKSMDSTGDLKVGDLVSRGQVIGSVGTSAAEAHLGNHLHFEIEENGKKIDPSGYLTLADK